MPPASSITVTLTKRSTASGAVPIIPVIFGLLFGLPALAWLIRRYQRSRTTSPCCIRELRLPTIRRRNGTSASDRLLSPIGQLAALAAVTVGAIGQWLVVRRIRCFRELLQQLHQQMNQTLDFGCRGGADAARAFSEEAPIAKSHAWYAMNRLKLVPARILWDRADHRRSLTSFALPHFSLRRKTSAQANEPRLRALHTSPDLSRISLSTSTGSALYCTTRPLRRAAAPTGYLDMSHDSFFDIELGPPTSPASTLTFPYGVPSPTWSEFSTTSTLPVSDESPKLPFSYSDSNLKKMGSLTGLGLRPRLGAFSASPPPSSPASARARCTSGRVVSPLSRSVPTRRRAQSDTSVLSQVQLQVAGLPGPETPQTPFGDPTTIVVKVYVPATADLWRIRIAEDTTFDELMDSIQSKLGYTVRLHVQVLTRPEGTTNTQCPPDETIAEAVAQIKSQEEFAGWMQDRLVFGSKHRLIAVRIE